MGKTEQVWHSLGKKEYRQEFAADVGTGLAFQIRMLREKNQWTQEELANRTGKKQETISEWENPAYGSYTLNSLRSLAAAFDVGLIVKFSPFSELVDWTTNLTPERLAPPSYDEENETLILKSLADASISLSADVWISDLNEGDLLWTLDTPSPRMGRRERPRVETAASAVEGERERVPASAA